MEEVAEQPIDFAETFYLEENDTPHNDDHASQKSQDNSSTFK